MRRILPGIASLILLVAPLALGGAPVSASSPVVTRAQFVYDFDRAIGLAPVYPAVPDFADVPASSPYYGYIEAAYRDGIIVGTGVNQFSPNGLLTRAQVAKIEVLAAGKGNDALAYMTRSTGFSDDAQVPSWARGYVIEAVKTGLVKGYPDGTFGPDATLTTSDESFFLKQYVATIGTETTPASLAVIPSSTDVAVGEQVTLSALAKNVSGQTVPNVDVTYSSDTQNGYVSGDIFVATAPGNYVVTATVPGGLSASVTIGVYGSAAALKLIPSGSLVADGQDQIQMQVEVVDTSGNVVRNAAGDVALFYLASSGGSSILINGSTGVNPMTLSAAFTDGATAVLTDGTATFTLRGGVVPGATDQLEAEEYTGTLSATPVLTPTPAQQNLTAATPVPTSVSLTGPSVVANNALTPVVENAQVLDQAGYPMLTGAYALTATLAGPAVFTGTSSTSSTFSYVASNTPSSPAKTSITLQAVQGQSGTITLTVASAGVAPGTRTLTAAALGTGQNISVTAPATTSFPESQGNVGLTFGVQITDAHGYPVPYSGTLDIEVTKGGQIANNISVDGYFQSTNGAPDPVAAQNGTFTVNDSRHGANAGTYTIVVTDPTGKLVSSAPVTFTETPGPIASIAVTSPAKVAVADPKATITATLEDLYGNTVPTSGVTISFSNDSSNPSPGVTLATSSATTVNGVATDVATAPTYIGNVYKVDASTAGTATYNTSFAVVATIASSLQVSFKDVAQGGNSVGTYVNSTTTAQASDSVNITVTAVDSYGQAIDQQDSIQLTFSTGGLVPQYSTGGSLVSAGANTWRDVLSASGTDTITCTAETAGTVSVSVSDLSVSSVSQTSAAFTVVAGRVWNYGVFNASGVNVGTNGLTVAANTATPLFISALDEYGNRTVTTTNVTVNLGDGNHGGDFRLSPTGSNITSIVMAPGVTQYPVYYTNASAGTYDLTATP